MCELRTVTRVSIRPVFARQAASGRRNASERALHRCESFVNHVANPRRRCCQRAAAPLVQAAVNAGDTTAICRAYRAVTDMGMTVTKAAVQLHDGYGMTEDLPYGQALRRMMTATLLFS